ncbi:MAG: MarR family transcriptional regulator [Actinocatenispora sp.]
MSKGRREELYAALNEAMRESASRTVMLHQTVAERFGLNSTDIKCLDLARDEPQITAGRLAALTGMSTSAVTAVIDRLERRGLVERRRDPGDRRKVIVVPTGRHLETGSAIFARLAEGLQEVLDEYDEDQLASFVSLMTRMNQLAHDFTAALTDEHLTEESTHDQ